MTAAHDYEHLHHLVDRLSPAQARRLRLIITQDEELSEVDREAPEEAEATSDDGLPDDFLALFGTISAPADYAERHDDYVRERMERRFGEAG
ncbi:hypothetical protein NLX86_13185 [Streptomyces sp. A3M-1-3]|uniref:hypothetical protein n=1 Tax=Streptomyces sp. A3M-1-3 TaxID=2962044 RepID=UPI0020B788BB|nr:hypothetical protein [Streptomyces sp. A3M-1-3]MCP3819034.1 hypothetical protein [Streptomyces sp. A3M-1-3]